MNVCLFFFKRAYDVIVQIESSLGLDMFHTLKILMEPEEPWAIFCLPDSLLVVDYMTSIMLRRSSALITDSLYP